MDKAKALAVTTPTKDKDGQPLVNGTGQVSEDEYERWVERTGWAPRFGMGDDSSSMEGTTMLDHQTFLESRLPDALYGGKSFFYSTIRVSANTSSLL